MLICHCHGVCDRTIRQCVRNGARSPEDIGEACGAGTGCGGCAPLVEQLIQLEAQRPEPPTRSLRPVERRGEAAANHEAA